MLIILTGKTASGKDTIARYILQTFPHIQKVLTTTTRKLRQGEQNGVDYNFITSDEFKKKIDEGQFIEWVSYGGNFYGTEKQNIQAVVKKDALWKIDPSRAGQIRQLIENSFDSEISKRLLRELVVIYITTENEAIQQRLKERSLTEEEINTRVTEDSTNWHKYKKNYDFIVENPTGKLDETIKEIVQIIESEKRKLI